MKKLLLLPIVGIFLLTGCQQSKSAKTVENLKVAIKNEMSLSALYSAYAIKAQQNHPAVAKFFEAASISDSIHAANLVLVLNDFGQKMDDFTPTVEVKNTLENIQSAIESEKKNVEVMYVGFISDLQLEKSEKAVQSFILIHDSELKRLDLFYKAINDVFKRIENPATFSSILPAGYAICPGCGNIYDNSVIADKCEFCATEKGKFIVI